MAANFRDSCTLTRCGWLQYLPGLFQKVEYMANLTLRTEHFRTGQIANTIPGRSIHGHNLHNV